MCVQNRHTERDGRITIPFFNDEPGVSIRSRKAIPKSIYEWSDSISRTASRESTIGVLIVKEPGLRNDNALVNLRYADWLILQRENDAVAEQVSSTFGWRGAGRATTPSAM